MEVTDDETCLARNYIYKFRYILITLIIILLASMVLFITGLGKDCTRKYFIFEQQHAQHYVMQRCHSLSWKI